MNLILRGYVAKPLVLLIKYVANFYEHFWGGARFEYDFQKNQLRNKLSLSSNQVATSPKSL